VDGTNMPMQVMDLTRLRNYAGTTMQLSADSTYAGGVGSLAVSKVHTLGINPDSGYLYLAGTRSETTPGSPNPAVGLHIVDVRNPASPTFAGAYTGDDYTHETQVITYQGPDLAWRGREIALNSNGKQGGRTDTFSIVDVTNKSAPAQIAAKTYANARYIHQGWITEDHKYFFQNDELDETGGVTGGRTRTHLWDIRDLDNPIYKGFYDHTTASIDHNLYVKGNYLYETNYTTGLRILKIGDLASSSPSQWLTEVAYYDTYQPNDGSTFSGAWNNYPFFPSGNVAISDINGGLFVVRPQLPADGPIGHSLKKDPFGGSNTAPLPEPGTAAMLAGLLAAAGMRRRR
jgi:choice-of-anchor B domain-containing protein